MAPAAPPAKRGPYTRTHRRREEIATAVLDLVDELGHGGVTTALVAQRSATAEATVLYHFPSRDHLLVAALERADQLDIDARGRPDEISLDLDALRSLGADSVQRHAPRRQLLEMLKGQAATPGHPAADYVRERNERALEIWTHLVADRQRHGLAHPGLDARQAALQILALWDGLTAFRLHDESVDVGGLLVDGIRRLTGENVVAARALLDDPAVGL
jgi:AcrR family transcriptional regulator